MKHVSVDVVTGFLGSGKTSLLSHVLSGALEGEKVAVVMNEIGDVGIDGRVITGLDYVENMVELNSGCICCTIDDYRFDLAIRELIETADPTLLIVESTGVAEPEPIVVRLAQAGLALDAIITVVDAANLDTALAETRVAREQVAAADFVVINKLDLVSPAELARVRRKLARMNRRALVVECERGRVQTDLMFGTSARRFRERRDAPYAPGTARPASGPDPAGGGHLHADGIGSFSYQSAAELDQARFERLLRRLPRAIYRAKGFVRVSGNPWSCLFNFTCGRYELNWVKLGEAAATTQAVFIGRDIARVRERVLRELARCEVTQAR